VPDNPDHLVERDANALPIDRARRGNFAAVSLFEVRRGADPKNVVGVVHDASALERAAPRDTATVVAAVAAALRRPYTSSFDEQRVADQLVLFRGGSLGFLVRIRRCRILWVRAKVDDARRVAAVQPLQLEARVLALELGELGLKRGREEAADGRPFAWDLSNPHSCLGAL
jgi:hypothetical protein